MINNYQYLCVKIPIINILVKNKYPIKGYFPRLSTVAKWRGGVHYNVSIYIETNTFYDFVSGDFGDPLSLHCLITGEDKRLIDFYKFYTYYNDINLNSNVQKMVMDNNCEIENFQEIEDEIISIYENAQPIFNDYYFPKKEILLNDSRIKQLKLSNFILSSLKKTKIHFNNLEKNLIKLNSSIVVPMYDIKTKKLQSLQYILPPERDLNKLFHFGGKLKYSIYPINFDISSIKDQENFILCEGIATGISICEILKNTKFERFPILACFNSSNINSVCNYLIEENKKILICSDYDQLNINKNKIMLSAGNRSANEFNKHDNVSITIANTGLSNSKYYLENIFDNNLTENKNFFNNVTDFNDIINKYGLDFARKVLLNNLSYYNKLFNKDNFLNDLTYYNQYDYSPFSYNYENDLNDLNNIILENQFIFY